MTNLLQQAINCDDPDRAAKIIRDALSIESDDVVNYCFPPGRLIASSAPVRSASGSRPRPAISRRNRSPPLPAAMVRRDEPALPSQPRLQCR